MPLSITSAARRGSGIKRATKLVVQAIILTDACRGVARHEAERNPGLSVGDALATPFLAIGTHHEIADHLLACRDRWANSYVRVRDMEAFVPVIQRLRRDREFTG